MWRCRFFIFYLRSQIFLSIFKIYRTNKKAKKFASLGTFCWKTVAKTLDLFPFFS